MTRILLLVFVAACHTSPVPMPVPVPTSPDMVATVCDAGAASTSDASPPASADLAPTVDLAPPACGPCYPLGPDGGMLCPCSCLIVCEPRTCLNADGGAIIIVESCGS